MSAQLAFPLPLPKARRSDGVTAHAAAKRVESGNGPLMQAIRLEMKFRRLRGCGPMSAFDIAEDVQRNNVDTDDKPRWKEGTVRSAVSRAPFLRHVDDEGRVPDTGNACRRYVLKDD